jgi:hypothetical protein
LLILIHLTTHKFCFGDQTIMHIVRTAFTRSIRRRRSRTIHEVQKINSHFVVPVCLYTQIFYTHNSSTNPVKFSIVVHMRAGIVQPVYCPTTDRTTGFHSLAEAKDFPIACVHTGSEAHPASCPMGTGALSRGNADQSLSSSAEVKNK